MMLPMTLPMTLPTDFLFDAEFCSRLGLVLLHSLWQVTALAMVAWGVERLWLKRSVEGSYGIYVAALLAALVAMPVTFGMLDRGVERSALQTAEAVAPVEVPVSNMPPVGPLPIENFELQVAPAAVASWPELPMAPVPVVAPSVWQRAAPWLVVVYGLGVVLMLVRLVRAWVSTHRLGSRAATVVDGPLVEMLQTLAQRWSMRVVPILAETREIVVPKVVGLARPMILLPTAAIAGLSAEELEMILAHEMAHVRRHDMWVNLLQRLAEVVLFFNPALWLLSRRISTLREYCCDEMTCEAMAGAESKNDPEPKLRYATALLRVAELAQPNAHNDLAALAASGRSPSELRRRVARLFGEPLREPVRVSRAGVFTLVTVALLIAFGPVIWRSEAHTTESTEQIPTAHEEQQSANPNAPATLSGKIVLEDGSPSTVKGWLHYDSRKDRSSYAGTVDEYGDRFHCEVPSGKVWLWYFAKGFSPAIVGPYDLASGEKKDVTITLKAGYRVPLRVVDAEGNPVPDAILTASPIVEGHSAGSPYSDGMIFDDRGEFLLENIVDVAYSMTVKASGFEHLHLDSQKMVPNKMLTLSMIRSQPASGIVFNADGNPAAFTKLFLKHTVTVVNEHHSRSFSGGSPYGDLATTTDAQGRFVLDQLARNSHYVFVIETTGEARLVVYDIKAGQQDIKITVPERRDLHVNVAGTINEQEPFRGSPTVYVRQRIEFNTRSDSRHSYLLGKNLPIETTPVGGTAIYRGLPVNPTENESQQQVEVSLNADVEGKVVDINPEGATNVEFVLPGAVDKGNATPRPKVQPQFQKVTTTRSAVKVRDHSAIWFHSGEHVHFVLYHQGPLQSGLEQTDYLDYPEKHAPCAWAFRGHITAVGAKHTTVLGRMPDIPGVAKFPIEQIVAHDRRFPLVFEYRPPGFLLYLEGETYDLAKGRVFVLDKNGEVAQLTVKPGIPGSKVEQITKLADAIALAQIAEPTVAANKATTVDGVQCRLVTVSPNSDDESPDLEKVAGEFASGDELTFAVELKNISAKPVTLLGTRYGGSYGEAKGRLNTKYFGPCLFEFEFTDARGQPVPRAERTFVRNPLALHGASAHELVSGESLTLLLRPAQFIAPMDSRLPPGKYRAKIRYHGPSEAAVAKITKHWPDSPQATAWASVVTSNMVEFSIAKDQAAAAPPPLLWGPENDGLQAALEFRPANEVTDRPSEAPGVPIGTSLKVVFHVKNVSDRMITFVSEAARQLDFVKMTDANGKEVKVRGSFYTGWPTNIRWKLKPGEVAQLHVLEPFDTKQAPGEYHVRYTIRFNSRQSKDGQGNITFPLKGDWQDELQTGDTPLFLRAKGAVEGKDESKNNTAYGSFSPANSANKRE